jgi:deoxycytidine triphosphate deaminase
MLHTRSTHARNNIQTHPSAGFGDPGFCSRWAIEITCQSPLVVTDLKMAQIEFVNVDDCVNLYTSEYNPKNEDWSIKNIIPKKDFFINNIVKRIK